MEIMQKPDLYALSKDELVYLISTIQHDLSQQLANYETILRTIRNISRYVSIDKCSFKGCHRFFYCEETDASMNIDYFNDGRITFCSCLANNCNCAKKADQGIGWWCKEHVPSSYKILNTKNFNFICGKCIEACDDIESE
jgi:hypothetical protein